MIGRVGGLAGGMMLAQASRVGCRGARPDCCLWGVTVTQEWVGVY